MGADSAEAKLAVQVRQSNCAHDCKVCPQIA
jgi:hypothetical protein